MAALKNPGPGFAGDRSCCVGSARRPARCMEGKRSSDDSALMFNPFP